MDGEAEFRALGKLFARVSEGDQVVKVLRTDLQPYAPFPVMALSVKSRLHTLAAQKCSRAIVLIDRELRDECPTEIAVGLENAIQVHCAPLPLSGVDVVVKNRFFENWLLSDVEAIESMSARFELTERTKRTIDAGLADSLNALDVIKTAAKGKAYAKIGDAVQVLGKADALRLAKGSRSFRRLLRVVGHPSYASQSKKSV